MDINNIKMIACDLDGTLIPEETHFLDPYFHKIVTECHRRGIHFVIASGRQINDLIHVIDSDDLNLVYLASNGAVICENDDTEPIVRAIPQDRVKAVVNRILAMPDTEFTMNAVLRTYVMPRTERFHRMTKEFVGEEIITVNRFEDIPEPIVKLSLFSFDGASVFNEQFRAEFSPEFNVDLSGRRWLDFTYTNKGEALERIARHHHIAPKQILVFGDNFNDLTMMNFAGYAVTVPTAVDTIKNAADEVTDNVVLYLKAKLATSDPL